MGNAVLRAAGIRVERQPSARAKYQGTIAKLSQDLGYMNSIDRRIEKIHSRMREYMESNTVCETAKEEA